MDLDVSGTRADWGVVIVKQFFLWSLLLWVAACEQPVFDIVDGPGLVPSDLEGQWLVINYWATWCGPCITEIPELNEMHHNSEYPIKVLGVDFDAPVEVEAKRSAILKMKIDFPVLANDPAPRFGYGLPEVLPTTVIIDPSGAVSRTLVGPQTEASILAAIDLN